ncbi:hypothetical protein GALMADRAFT_56685 [Galerina marginata CBS 339.88]|uniref:Uncharacterized protein n=1 Tax=Galerina marginata (strain CBS 339.88) TaxID=685588 RepID=A0A067TNZ5_GALM3|nr:hypothetical protein GALMADRAFT_56685 [Galerina marginata CBS 339.88]
MIPLVPALILAFVSFIASAFVVLRIVIPILPPHPLSKRVSPAEFGLPTFRSLSPADKSHLWLACLDLLALVLFIWQFVNESTIGPSGVALATDPASAIRLWIAVTIRQTCLLIVASVTLLHVRMAQSVSFGARHWMLWAPTALLVITSTTIAGLLSGTGVHSLFYGLTAYTTAIAVLSSIAFGSLIRTLFVIKKNLSSLNEVDEPWPPVREMEEKPRPSFATEEIDAIRDGASWITSNASSRRGSISTWSFSTHQTVTTSQHGHGRPQKATHPSVPAKSSFWFGSTTANDVQVPPVPPLPSPYGPISPTLADSDPFRRDLPPLPNHPRTRLGSQSSWLTSSNGSHTTVTSWSYPTTYHDGTVGNDSVQDLHTAYSPATRPTTPALADAQVLGGYGFAPGGIEAEKGMAALAAPPGTTIEVSSVPAIGWSVMIWLPLGFSLPYFIVLSQNSVPSTALQVMFVLSITLSSPLLALNLLFGSPLPIPVGLFDDRDALPADPQRPHIHGSLPPHKWSHEYKRSTSCSVTVVEGRRSGDVWLSKGDAVDGKGKIGRAIGLLSATPKLSVLPPEENNDEFDMPPIPFQDDSLPVNVNGTPHSENSVQFGRLRKDSKASSHFSGGDESLAFASRIMIAQRHYSTLAQTVVVPGAAGGSATGGNRDSVGAATLVGVATGATTSKRASHSSHLRSRSVSSVNNGPETPTQERFNISPPPSFPLPPTPPNVRAARLAMLAHKKSFSSGHDFSFKPVDDINEIDAMTAGVLPLLVPGLTVGEDMKIKKGNYTPPGSYSKSKGKKVAKKLTEFGEDFSSPEVHSTPARRRQPRGRKESGHKRNHFSLPSLSLGKEMHSLAVWSAEIRNALETKVGQYTAVPGNVDIGRRNTVIGVESALNGMSHLQSVEEEEDSRSFKPLGRAMSTRSLGLLPDVPQSVSTARSSVASIGNIPPASAASTVTLFEEFEAGLESGPQAESTPHNSVSQKPTSRHPPPPMSDRRRSTIRYIKSENTENEPITYPMEETDPNPEMATSAISSFAQWSSRAVRPLMPKASKLQRSPSDAAAPKEGMRTLTLLQDRGNIVNSSTNAGPTTAEIRPLTLGKRQKSRVTANRDENVIPGEPTTRHKNLKSLTLVRSDTSKMRGVLRKTEVLPDVVVRPPSTSEHNAFTYNFQD